MRNYLRIVLTRVLCFWGILYVGRSGVVQKDKDRVEVIDLDSWMLIMKNGFCFKRGTQEC